MKSKRPWKRYARIERVEHNSGDVKFKTFGSKWDGHYRVETERHEFESKTEAETDLDEWFADWWPKQVKSRRPA